MPRERTPLDRRCARLDEADPRVGSKSTSMSDHCAELAQVFISGCAGPISYVMPCARPSVLEGGRNVDSVFFASVEFIKVVPACLGVSRLPHSSQSGSCCLATSNRLTTVSHSQGMPELLRRAYH